MKRGGLNCMSERELDQLINGCSIELSCDGCNKRFMSSCLLCEILKVRRVIIQELVKRREITMYNGLISVDDVLRLFPRMVRASVVQKAL